jgi:hypothetical protein
MFQDENKMEALSNQSLLEVQKTEDTKFTFKRQILHGTEGCILSGNLEIDNHGKVLWLKCKISD